MHFDINLNPLRCKKLSLKDLLPASAFCNIRKMQPSEIFVEEIDLKFLLETSLKIY